MARVADNSARSKYQHMFVDEMRESKMLNVCVRDYDELPHDRAERTWEFVEKKGRACFERARLRDNRAQTRHILSRKPHPQAAVDVAVAGVPYVPPSGQGQRPQTFPQTPRGIVDPGNWPDATPRPTKQQRVPITQEQQEANGPCWFYGTGACVRKDCNKAHRIMIYLERVAIPSAWVNWNFPGKDGYRIDRSQTETDDPGKGPKRWEEDNRPSGGPKGEGKAFKGSRPCRFVKDGGVRPHGLLCYSFWSHPPPVDPIDIAEKIKQSASTKSLSAASASDSGAIPWTGVKPAIQD
jgi:hypothetical protein